MSQTFEQEITVTGSLLSITLFEQKMMKNFLIISNKLRRLEGLFEYQQKQKALEKQFKFLTMKVDTIVEKLPKDFGSINRNDVKLIAKDLFFEVLNSSDQKLTKSKFHDDIIQEISKHKQGVNQNNPSKEQPTNGKKEGHKASFTAGQVLRDTEKSKNQSPKENLPLETLKEVLDQNQFKLVNQMFQKKDEKQEKQRNAAIKELNHKFDQLQKAVDELRMGRGYATYLQREAEKFERFEQFEEKSRQTTRKIKDKPIQLEGIKVENVKGEILKNGLLSDLQRMQNNKEQIAKYQLMQRKTLISNYPKENRIGEKQKQISYLKDTTKDGGKEKDPYISSLKDNNKEPQTFKKSHSIRKLDKIDKLDRKLKVDDMKELNAVLRQIELRIESKVSHDIFMGFVKDFQEKLQVLRLSRDSSSQINELRKNFYILQSKIQSVISFLQSSAQQDDAVFVKKQWTCISCDKSLQKFQGKVGQHLNWQSIASKKISPTKLGAFGQTGQLAAKIRNLMQGEQGQE